MPYPPALDHLFSRLDDQRKIVVESIVGGQLAQNEYHRLCGVIQGIDFAKALIDDLAKRLENDDE